MPLEVGLWRVDGPAPIKVTPSGVPLEAKLEKMIESDPTILGTPLLLIGRQVQTDYGKFIDLLAVDDDGNLHVLELKRDKTPREIVAQLLDYGSWVRALTHDDVLSLFSSYAAGSAFEEAWTATFGGNPPDELNVSHRLTVVAGDVDPATERIITYLAGFDVPINVVFFRYFNDADRSYLARTWLLDETLVHKKGRHPGGKETWNEHDWYVSFGDEVSGRDWEDARNFGFVSAGGGEWFSKTLRKLPIGARVFACIPKAGYVGVGTVIAESAPFEDAEVLIGGERQPLSALPLQGTYHHAPSPDEDTAEYVVPVQWEVTRPRALAVWHKGMFANQNSACKLRNQFTLECLTTEFQLERE